VSGKLAQYFRQGLFMKYGNVPGVAKPISRLVQGTASFDTNKPDECFKLLDLAFENGFTAIDHAHCYGREKEKGRRMDQVPRRSREVGDPR
jgi:diketogulonate reductase-like aldo/keto reductase